MNRRPHTEFFSSLKHLEKRLELENNEAAPPSNTTEQTDSLGTPIYLCSHIQEREEEEEEAEDRVDVELLMQLLRLSDAGANEVGPVCDDEFYDRIVGVKGPKEFQRLERWIKHFSNTEPFRLAHLMLGKAAFVHSDDGFVFPSTIDDFLQNEPPTD